MNDPLESTSAEDLETRLWVEVQAARAELREAGSRPYQNMDERFDRSHDIDQALARLTEAEDAWYGHINRKNIMSRKHRVNPDSEDCQRMERENKRYVGGLQLEAKQRATDFETIERMALYGGGFVRALAGAARHADADNLRRIKAAFPEYWEKYSEMDQP